MVERFYDVEVVITRQMRVRVPDAIVESGERSETVAEEIAIGGLPEYVVSQSDDLEVESVREVQSVGA